MQPKIITSEEIRKLPLEEREQIFSKMTEKELDLFLGIKPEIKFARKHPNETAAQVVRRLRAQTEKGAFVL